MNNYSSLLPGNFSLNPSNPEFLAFVPMFPPPPGEVSNLESSPSRGYLLTVIASVVLVFQILFFLLKIYSRAFVARKLKWDDLTCTLGFVCTLAFYIICILLVRTAYDGRHSWDTSVEQYNSSNLFVYQLILECLNPAGLAFIKLTFFIFYWELFSIKPWSRVAILIGAISSTVFYIICIGIQLRIGLPRKGQSFFERSTEATNDEKLFAMPQAGFSVFFDLYILILPIWSVFQLKLSFKRALGVSMVFLTGILACVCSIVSLYYRVRMDKTRDVFWIFPIVLVTSLVEMQTGIICCCMPALPYLFHVAKNANSHVVESSKNIYVRSEVTTANNTLKSDWRGDHNVTITANEDGDSKEGYATGDIANAV